MANYFQFCLGEGFVERSCMRSPHAFCSVDTCRTCDSLPFCPPSIAVHTPRGGSATLVRGRNRGAFTGRKTQAASSSRISSVSIFHSSTRSRAWRIFSLLDNTCFLSDRCRPRLLHGHRPVIRRIAGEQTARLVRNALTGAGCCQVPL